MKTNLTAWRPKRATDFQESIRSASEKANKQHELATTFATDFLDEVCQRTESWIRYALENKYRFVVVCIAAVESGIALYAFFGSTLDDTIPGDDTVSSDDFPKIYNVYDLSEMSQDDINKLLEGCAK